MGIDNNLNFLIFKPQMISQISLEQCKDFYSKDHQSRYQSLIDKFIKIYNQKPDFIARAPGRVNIIGQHIDYEGYGVFPSAIEKDCLIAVRTSQSKTLEIHHFDQDSYPSFKTSNNPPLVEQYPNKYLKYLISGYRAGIQKLGIQSLVGMQILITGNVPIGSGLSSSAALVVCSALASLYANKQNGKRQTVEFIQECIRRQRECGVACGGMDQSISVMGKLFNCLYIQFNPIRCETIHIPDGCKLIIMNSLVQNFKEDSAYFRYNKRVVQCRLGLYLLSKNLNLKEETYQKWKILKQLQEYLGLPLQMVSLLAENSIERRLYTKQELEGLLGKNVWNLISDIQLYREVLQANQTFNLFDAVSHVFKEAQRVLDVIQICRSSLPNSKKNVFFGKLMNQSHESCRDVYRCSCQQLDELTSLALKYGALGSRLTGAGWGGCTVSLVQNEKVSQFIEDMRKSYYAKEPLKQKILKQGQQNVIFESKPCQGACIIRLI